MQNLVHSFYGLNCKKVNMFINHICFVLSCICAKKIGYNIELHCDSETEKLFSIAPYDNIYIDLDNLIQPNKIYAKPKFDIMKDKPLGDIHIDGDVFLIDENYKDILLFDNYDVIVQCKETPKNIGSTIEWENSQKSLINCNYPSFANRTCNKMYNCGVIGINNAELKNIYFDTYYKMLEEYEQNGLIIDRSVPDIIIEQQFLCDLCENNHYKVKFILDENDLQGSAKEIGYNHLIGNSKYKLYESILKMIKKLDLNTYNKIKNIHKTFF